jgi:hypothetical protein|tara:strand:+ start:1371 stop:1613 length:243 start_codon:yes stop_codon:yes gene_type:complete
VDVFVNVSVAKVASASPDAVKQTDPQTFRSLAALMEKHPISDLQTVDRRAALTEEPPVLDLHQMASLRVDHLAENIFIIE